MTRIEALDAKLQSAQRKCFLTNRARKRAAVYGNCENTLNCAPMDENGQEDTAFCAWDESMTVPQIALLVAHRQSGTQRRTVVRCRVHGDRPGVGSRLRHPKRQGRDYQHGNRTCPFHYDQFHGQLCRPRARDRTLHVRVEAAGFKASERTGITLNVNDTVRADAALQVGEAKESVTVEANAVQVQADTNEVSQTITAAQVADLATNGRNVIQLAALVPGASAVHSGFRLPDGSEPKPLHLLQRPAAGSQQLADQWCRSL